MNETLQAKLELLPDAPGVYRMMDARGDIIYVGKAVSLKNRVRQYFQSSRNMPPKVVAMVSHIADFDYILTLSETEAFTLEASLVKQYQPRYNILLKDDKHFPYIRIDLNKDFPQVGVVRRFERDGAKYLGPYLSAIALRDALNIVREHFPIRHCKKDLKKAMARGERPCLYYHLGKCCAPCTGNVTREEYHAMLQEVISFLEGNVKPVVEALKGRMQQAAEDLEFEKAAKLRDSILALERLQDKQQAIAPSTVERDVFALAREKGVTLVYAFFIRGGKVIGTDKFFLRDLGEEENQVMASFLKQYYAQAGAVPAEVVLNVLPEEQEEILRWLSSLRKKKVTMILPARGDRKKQLDLAFENAKEAIEREQSVKERLWDRGEGAAVELANLIGLEEMPERMECYDNSHIRGQDTVSSMVVFTNGMPDKKEYRRFRIRQDTGGDDYLAMREVLTRRFERAKEQDGKFSKLPDLLIVDGGRGQLNVALEVLKETGFDFIPAMGLAEQNEEIILPDRKDPIELDRSSPVLHLVQRIRDEAHRFAVSYHRSLRSKNSLNSVLNEIPGVGPKRKKALFDAFLTVEQLKGATLEDIEGVKGVDKRTAKAVYDFFHPSEQGEQDQ